MAGATRQPSDAQRQFRDPPQAAQKKHPQISVRVISVAWASIAGGDILPGELLFNRNDNSLVYRKDETNIYRFDSTATRAI